VRKRRASLVRSASIAVFFVGIALTALVAGPSGKALATNMTPSVKGKYCGTYGTGRTSAIIEGGYDVWTVWIKPRPGCHDFNLVYVDADGACQTRCQSHAYDYYEGAYERKGRWIPGAIGFHKLYNGNVGDVVLLTNVLTGTRMSIESHNLGDQVHVNY
jgi:hypothetical protein